MITKSHSILRPGVLINSDSFRGRLFEGARLYEGGAYLKILINEGVLIFTRIKLRKK